MAKYILSLDQGTTGCTAAIINSNDLCFVDKVNFEFPQIFPRPSWVEHDLNDIWSTTKKSVIELFKKNNIKSNEIISIGITNQRETTCAFNSMGTPLANAIVWQDRRTTNTCKMLKSNEDKIIQLTGLPIDPYFSATKMKWLLENNDHVKNAYKSSDLKFGTVDTFLLYKLTSGNSFKTDATNASRTLLMNLKDCKWSSELCSIFDIPMNCLPEICDSFTNFGSTKGLDFLPDGIPINCILGDQQAALFGQAGFHPGDIKCTYGTGAFVLLNIGNTIQYSKNKLLTTVAYKYKNEVSYALEGSCYIAGAAVQWLRDNLKIINKASEIENLANQITNLEEMESVIFMPFFSGLASPYWKPEARAAILGITRDTNKSHIARACLEGIALSINDLIESMKEDSVSEIRSLKVDGGATVNNLLMQIQATIGNISVIRPTVIETTSYGAALGAALGSGICNIEDIKNKWKSDNVFEANPDWNSYYINKMSLWKKSIPATYLTNDT